MLCAGIFLAVIVPFFETFYEDYIGLLKTLWYLSVGFRSLLSQKHFHGQDHDAMIITSCKILLFICTLILLQMAS